MAPSNEQVGRYRMALEAIASMRPTADTNMTDFAAMLSAIANISLNPNLPMPKGLEEEKS